MHLKRHRLVSLLMFSFLIAGLFVSTFAFLNNSAEAQVAALSSPNSTVNQRAAHLTRGVNLAFWFRSGDGKLSKSHALDYITDATIKEIKQRGFDHVRLPVQPKFFYQESNPGVLKTDFLTPLDLAIEKLIKNNLAVIVDFHVVPEDGISDKLENQPGYVNKVAAFWRTFSQFLSKHRETMLFMETMNEPMFLDPPKWYSIQETLLKEMRKGAPRHTFIANSNNLQTGDKPGEPESLLEIVKPYADTNLIYNFHFYDPMEFTHQSADWTPFAGLKNLPYPSSPTACTKFLTELSGSTKQKAQNYCNARWNYTKIEAKVKKAYDWGKKYGVRLIVDEFGAYDEDATLTPRMNYLRDVRLALEKYTIGWTIWGWDDNFGPTYFDWDKNKWIFYSEAMYALGLNQGKNAPTPKPTATPKPTPLPGQPEPDDDGPPDNDPRRGTPIYDDNPDEEGVIDRKPKPGDQVSKLRKPNGRHIKLDPSSEIRFNFQVTNRQWQHKDETYVVFEKSPQLEVGYTEFSDKRVWVSKVTENAVEIRLPAIDIGVTLEGALIFRPAATAQEGDEVFTRYRLFSKEDALISTSNAVRLKLTANPTDTDSDGSLQDMSGAATEVENEFLIGGDFFGSNERVGFWYTTPSGKNEGLGEFDTDEDGYVKKPFNLEKLTEPGTYLIVAYGKQTGVTGIFFFEVKPKQETSKEEAPKESTGE